MCDSPHENQQYLNQVSMFKCYFLVAEVLREDRESGVAGDAG